MIQKLRYYISDSLDPYKNLATEKYLLDTVSDDCCTLYLWQNQNTVVIGKNQNPWNECRCSLLNEDGCKLARRLSGGGAVFHDIGNLNFTFLCSTENYDLTRQMNVIKEACKLAGINAIVSGRNDILVEGYKFSGNAFYNSKGKSYHHGTLLIDTDKERLGKYLTPSNAKLASKGVKSVKSRVANLTEFLPELTCDTMTEYMIKAFQNVYRLPAEQFEFIDEGKISEYEKEFSSWEYLYGSTIPFSLTMEEYFPWGNIELLLDIKNGAISSVQIFTDALDWQLPEIIISALAGCRFEIPVIKDTLTQTLPQSLANDIVRLFENQKL